MGADAAWSRRLAGVAVSMSDGGGTHACPGAGTRDTFARVHQHLPDHVGERPATRLVGDVEAPDVAAAVAHRRALEGAAREHARRQPERAHVVAEVDRANGSVEAAQMREQAQGRRAFATCRRPLP